MSEISSRQILVATASVVGMLAIYVLGMHVRGARFEMSGTELEQDFWMESAQRFRYVEIIAGGERLPNPDTTMWAPDGYDPRTDTIAQEHFYKQEFERALEYVDHSIALHETAEANALKGSILLMLKRPVEAREFWERALRLNPDMPGVDDIIQLLDNGGTKQ